MKRAIGAIVCSSVLFITSSPAQESGLIAHGAEVVEVQSGFDFLEGPVSTRDGTLLLRCAKTRPKSFLMLAALLGQTAVATESVDAPLFQRRQH